MKSSIAAVVIIAVLAVAGGMFFVLSQTGQGNVDPPVDDDDVYVPSESDPLDWIQWCGNDVLSGVSDGRSPITVAGMTEVWKVESTIDSASTNWKTAGTPICIGDRTFYYSASDQSVHCVKTSTGKEIMKASCPSDGVYNMPIACGDGKVFVPACNEGFVSVHAFDQDTLKQLFVTSPMDGGQVQGPIVYHDGRIFFGMYMGYYVCFSTQDVDGKTAPSGKAWVMFQWAPPAGWNTVSVDRQLDVKDGSSFCINLSDVQNDGSVVTYSAPEMEPVSTAHFFIQFREQYDANDLISNYLTLAERQRGFWIEGEGSDATSAFKDACEKAGMELNLHYEEGSTGLKGWLNSFMGLSDEPVGTSGLWTYWCQFHWADSKWQYNQKTLGYYDPGVCPYYSLIRMTTGEEDADAGLNINPEAIFGN